jgi:hypothetical protein
MRISVSNWSTDEADVEAGVGAILKLADELADQVQGVPVRRVRAR